MEKAGHQVQQGLAVIGLTKSCRPALPGEPTIWDTEKRKAPFRKAVCSPPASCNSFPKQSQIWSIPGQKVNQAALDLAITQSYLDSSIPQFGDELQSLFKELLLGRGHQHLCLRCPDLFLGGLQRGQDPKDATDITRHLRCQHDGSPLSSINLAVKRTGLRGINSINSESGRSHRSHPKAESIFHDVCLTQPPLCFSTPKSLLNICSKQLRSNTHRRM